MIPQRDRSFPGRPGPAQPPAPPRQVVPIQVADDPEFPAVTFEELTEWAESGVYESFRATIPPDVCGRLLERPLLKLRQRHLTESAVVRLVREIQEGRWNPRNGDSVAFCPPGDLFDGRHRLAAASRAGFRLPTLVVVGADPEAFGTKDIGLKRTDAHILTIAGEENATALAAAVKVLWRIEQDPARYDEAATPGSSAIASVVDRYPRLRDAVRATQDKTVRSLLPSSVAAATYYLFSEKDPGAAEEFFRLLKTGANLDDTHPILKLRNRLLEFRTGRSGSRQSETLALTIKSWNAYREGRTVQLLAWRRDEAFPCVK